MRYDVIWQPIAEAELASIWLAATNRNAITRSAALAEAALTRVPLRIGESRTSSVHRIAYFAAIAIEYEVIEDDKRVIVRGVFAV